MSGLVMRRYFGGLTLALCLAFALVAATAGPARADAPAELKLSVAVGPAYALGKAAGRWAKRVAPPDGGGLAVKVFPGATLARRDPAREFGALRDGAADLAIGSTLQWAGEVKALGVVGLPWIAPGADALDALATGPVADALAAAVARAGAVPLAFAPLGHRALATRESVVQAPADLAGLAVRVAATPALAAFYTALGAQPTTMTFGAAEGALAAGTLDAQDGTPAQFAAAQVAAIGMKRVLLWDAIAEVAVFAANRARWDAWSEAERARVRASAQETAVELAALARADERAALAALARSGLTVTRLTAAGRAPFVAATRGLYDAAAATVGAELVRSAEAAVAAAAPNPSGTSR